ncbi:MAG: glycosyltransferase family 4 protein [Planctomycetes bacterium]|nr:glycosyltransferase family 4 protein [Planctomycetota bacterium]
MTCDALRPPVRGVGRVCESLLAELGPAGANVTPLDMERNEYATHLSGNSCEVLRAPIGPAKTARWYAGLLPRIRRRGYRHEVVLSTAGFPHVFGDDPRLAVFVHDLHMLEAGFYQRGKRAWFRAFLGRSLAHASLRICVSEHTRRELERHFPELDPQDNVVVHNAAPDTLGLGADPVPLGGGHHFLFVGQLERRKNLMRLLDAYESSGVETELHLVGRPGPGGDEILARARRARGVHLHTEAPDALLRDLYRDARAVLIPSLAEGFGLPVVEAMRAGAPVLTSSGTALAEVAGDAALLVDPTDTDAIRAGIVALESNDALRVDLAKRGTERASAFTPQAQARALVAALEHKFG